MTLANKLARIRQQLPQGSKGTAAHLFGVLYASELDPLPISDLDDLAEDAGLDRSIGSEVRKGVKLASYVTATLHTKRKYRP